MAYIRIVVEAEKTLIARVRKLAKKPGTSVIKTGIGDDCAVLRWPVWGSRHIDDDVLVTTDFSLQGIHFRKDWHPAKAVGHRCLARGLSDIAAMGGEPLAAFLSLALPGDVTQKWVKDFFQGLLSLASDFNVTLAGGDTAESPSGILADIVVLGSVPRGEAVERSGARPGDLVYVTGKLGGAAATLDLMFSQPGRKLDPREHPRHFFPEPRVTVGKFLRERKLVSAMIDTSDGLSTDLAHICEESGVGAEIQAAAIPRATVGKQKREVDLQTALHGGEDYELLFTAPRGKQLPAKIAGVAVTKIGRITRVPQMILIDTAGATNPFKAQGWEHLRRSKKPR